MADLKAAFRAAKEQKGGAKAPTAAQIRAMKAAKLQQKQPSVASAGAAASAAVPSSSAPSSGSRTMAAGSAVQAKPPLPQDFFQSPSKASAPAAVQQRPTAVPRTTLAQNPSSAAVAPGPAAPVPEGFFADKAADAKARGVKLPDAKDIENEFQAFQRSIEEDLKHAAAEEAQEAEEDAADKEDRDGFAQWVLMQHVEELRKRKAEGEVTDAATVTAEMLGLLPSGSSLNEAAQQQIQVDAGAGPGPGTGGTQPSISLPKRRKLQDTLAALAAHSSGDEASEAEEGGNAGGLLDWRRKGV